jgi:hypothetical protein
LVTFGSTSAGYVLRLSTATTWSPAPIAYSISVAVGERLTIFSEFSADGVVVSDESDEPPHAATKKTEAAIRPNARLRSERVFFMWIFLQVHVWRKKSGSQNPA